MSSPNQNSIILKLNNNIYSALLHSILILFACYRRVIFFIICTERFRENKRETMCWEYMEYKGECEMKAEHQ